MTITPSGRPRRDHVFFTLSALYIFAAIMLGFARSYLVPGMVFAKLPSWIVHVHAALFVTWVLLYVLQTMLVAVGKIRLHMTLGIAVFGLSIAMVLAGTAAAFFSFAHDDGPPGIPRSLFLEGNLTTILVIFPVLVAAAWRCRFRQAQHKRLILLANVALVGAGILRWPIPAIADNGLVVSLLAYLPWLALFTYDLRTTGRVQSATLWGGLFLVVVDQSQPFLAQTSAWNRIAGELLRIIGG